MTRPETRILIEKHERTIVRPLRDAVHGFCIECGAESRFLIPEHAAAAAHVTVREIYRRVESGALHFIESSDGTTLICRASISEPDQAEPILLSEQNALTGELEERR